jgi:hypothetical protein
MLDLKKFSTLAVIQVVLHLSIFIMKIYLIYRTYSLTTFTIYSKLLIIGMVSIVFHTLNDPGMVNIVIGKKPTSTSKDPADSTNTFAARSHASIFSAAWSISKDVPMVPVLMK